MQARRSIAIYSTEVVRFLLTIQGKPHPEHATLVARIVKFVKASTDGWLTFEVTYK